MMRTATDPPDGELGFTPLRPADGTRVNYGVWNLTARGIALSALIWVTLTSGGWLKIIIVFIVTIS